MQNLRESVRWKKNRIKRGEEIDAFVILFCLSNKLISRRIGHLKSEIGPSNCICSCPECVLEYMRHLAPRNIVRQIWEDTYKVSFTDFWSWSSTFIKCKIVDSHELYKVTNFITIITNKLDRLQESEKYQWKTS